MLIGKERDEGSYCWSPNKWKPTFFLTQQYPTLRMFFFLRVLYRICNPILLSIRIFNPTTLTLLQVFYCVLRVAKPYINKRRIADSPQRAGTSAATGRRRGTSNATGRIRFTQCCTCNWNLGYGKCFLCCGLKNLILTATGTYVLLNVL